MKLLILLLASCKLGDLSTEVISIVLLMNNNDTVTNDNYIFTHIWSISVELYPNKLAINSKLCAMYVCSYTQCESAKLINHAQNT